MVWAKDNSDLSFSHLTRLASPERPRAPVPDLHISLGGSAVVPPGSPLASPGDSQGSSPLVERRPMPLFVPEVEEIRISPVVSRKGYLNVLDDRTNNWIKRWVVSGIVSIEELLQWYISCRHSSSRNSSMEMYPQWTKMSKTLHKDFASISVCSTPRWWGDLTSLSSEMSVTQWSVAWSILPRLRLSILRTNRPWCECATPSGKLW